MKDIDFDELDKAVNSLMASSSLQKADEPNDPQPHNETTLTLNNVPTPQPTNPTPSSAERVSASQVSLAQPESASTPVPEPVLPPLAT